MRRRSAADAHAADVARRRLEALSRELGLDVDDEVSDDAFAAVAGPARPRAPREPRGAGEEPFRGGRERVAPVEESGRGGRHALPRLSWRERLGLRLSERGTGARQFGAAHLAVVVLLVAVSLAVGAWHTMRGSVEPAPVGAPTLGGGPSGAAAATGGTGVEGADPGSTPSPGNLGTGSDANGEADGAQVVVDVVGKVREPGIAVLPAGSRVVDALEAAGGARPGVRTDSLNLARPLADGEQIVVGPAPAPAAPPAAAGAAVGPSAGASPTALVDLNTADQVALETLPGVGPVTAAAILQWRTEHGGFTAVEELLEVSGIGDATLAEIAPHVTL